MARKSDLDGTRETTQRIAAGLRVAALRFTMGMNVLDFAIELNAVARRLQLPERWSGPKVSKIETGTQNLTVEDVAVLAAYDPEDHGPFWWAFGRQEPKEPKPSKQPERKGDGAKRKRSG